MKNIQKKIRVGIDARLFSSTATGIGRHVFELVRQLSILDKKNKYTIFLRAKNFKDFQIKNENFCAEVADFQHYSLGEQVGFCRQISKKKFDLMIFPHFNVPIFYRGRFFVTIHDLTIHFFPGKKSNFFKFFWYKVIIANAAKRAKLIFSVSKNTKKDIVEILKIKKDKILVVGNGVSEGFEQKFSQSQLADFRKKYKLPKKYFLYAGVFREHKNIFGMVRGFAIFAKKNANFSLVIAGTQDAIYFPEILKLVDSLKIKNRVIFPGFFPERDFSALFSSATAFIFPSFYEGFGIPPLEAMACKTPVACSNSSSLPEVCGDAALYFDPKKPEEIAKKMEEILQPDTRKKMISRGLRQIGKFSWKAVGERYFSAIKNFSQHFNSKIS